MSARLVVHDFSGHPFQVQLARELATRDFDVTHLYCSSFQTPRGNVDDESERFSSRGVALRRRFAKYSGARRFVQELEYGWRLGREIRAVDPSVVISSNTPLLAAAVLQIILLVRRIPVVFWQQDVYSLAMSDHLESRLGVIGRSIGWCLRRIERWLLRTSQQIVVISVDFLPTLVDWKVDPDRVTVIENWAPLDELPARSRPNAWSRDHAIDDEEIVLLYAGTLGLKHEPSVLLDLARAMSDRHDVRVVVASEGIGANWLRAHRTADDPLELLPFQPFSAMPDMLGSADVLLVLLEPSAGAFSVPSKVLTYQCAGRAILGAMPAANLASRNIIAAGAGIVVDPGDAEAFIKSAIELVDDPGLRDRLGEQARAYAERTFDIGVIGDKFVATIGAARST